LAALCGYLLSQERGGSRREDEAFAAVRRGTGTATLAARRCQFYFSSHNLRALGERFTELAFHGINTSRP
jgi:hypothetical protein